MESGISVLNDRTYAERYLSGDTAALAKLKQRHGKAIYWAAFARHQRHDVALDAAAAVWAALTADDGARLRRWLAVPSNFTLSILVGHVASALDPDDMVEERAVYAPPRCKRGIEALALRLGALHGIPVDVARCKSLLSEMQREIDRLDNLPVKSAPDRPKDADIAQRLEVSEQHVRRVRRKAEAAVEAYVKGMAGGKT